MAGGGHAVAGDLAQRFQHTQWTREDGLPANTITDIAQTPDGFLWIATPEGLARYDGARFKVLDRKRLPILESDIITKLEVDAAGRLWVATMTGGVYYKDAAGWHRVAMPRGEEELLVINLALGAQGTVWAGTNRGLARIRRGEAGYLLEASVAERDHPVTFLGALDSGSVWYVRRGANGIRRLQDSRASAQGKEESIAHPERFVRVWPVGKGLALFDWRSGIHFVGGNLPQRALGFEEIPDVSDVLVDGSRTIWIGTLDRGLLAATETGAVVNVGETFKSLDGLIRDVFLAKDGAIWVGTDKQGLIRLRRPEVRFYESASGKPMGYANAVTQAPSGRIYAAVSRGLAEFSPDEDVFVMSDKPSFAGEVLAFGTYGNGALVASVKPSGLVDVESGRKIPIDRSALRKKSDFFALLSTRNADTVIANSHGVIAIRDGKARNLEEADVGPMSIALFEQTPGAIWVGSIDRLRLLKDGRFVDHPYAEGLRGKWISGFAPAAGGGLWVASYGDGVFLAAGGKLRQFHESAGFPENNLNGLIKDRIGNLWFMTNSGVYRVREKDLIARADQDMSQIPAKLFDRRHGLLFEETGGGQQPLAFIARDGALWLATAGGVGRIGLDAQGQRGVAPSVHIDDVRADGAFELKAGKRLDFAEGTRRIEIDVAAPELVDGNSIRIRHRIRSFDSDWNVLHEGRTVHLGNLPPGDHTLELMASDHEGRWVGAIERLDIRIAPFFHQTAWFKWLMVLLISATAYGFHRIRLWIVKARYAVVEERARIAAELHDGIAQGFSGIALQIEAAMADERVPEAATGRMRRARELAVSSMDDLRRSIRLLSPHSDEQRNVIDCVQAVIRDLRAPGAAGIRFEFEGVPYELPVDTIHHLERIVRQSIANAIEHADAATIMVAVRFRHDRLIVDIADDGRGYGAASRDADSGRGFGVISLQKRAIGIGGKLSIRSTAGAGTLVRLVIHRGGIRKWLSAIGLRV